MAGSSSEALLNLMGSVQRQRDGHRKVRRLILDTSTKGGDAYASLVKEEGLGGSSYHSTSSPGESLAAAVAADGANGGADGLGDEGGLGVVHGVGSAPSLTGGQRSGHNSGHGSGRGTAPPLSLSSPTHSGSYDQDGDLRMDDASLLSGRGGGGNGVGSAFPAVDDDGGGPSPSSLMPLQSKGSMNTDMALSALASFLPGSSGELAEVLGRLQLTNGSMSGERAGRQEVSFDTVRGGVWGPQGEGKREDGGGRQAEQS